MQKIYYHAAPIILDRGSIIKPGNFGRLIKGYKHSQQINVNQLVMAYRERVL